jgi:hypothetical protein
MSGFTGWKSADEGMCTRVTLSRDRPRDPFFIFIFTLCSSSMPSSNLHRISSVFPLASTSLPSQLPANRHLQTCLPATRGRGGATATLPPTHCRSPAAAPDNPGNPNLDSWRRRRRPTPIRLSARQRHPRRRLAPPTASASATATAVGPPLRTGTDSSSSDTDAETA